MVVIAAIASLGAVVTGAYTLTAYFGAAVLALAASVIFPAPLSVALRKGAAAVGTVVLAWCAAVSLTAFPVAFGAEPLGLLRWEIPAIGAACAVGVLVVRAGWRRDYPRRLRRRRRARRGRPVGAPVGAYRVVRGGRARDGDDRVRLAGTAATGPRLDRGLPVDPRHRTRRHVRAREQ